MENKHSNLSISDWVTFLSGERDVGYNTVLNIGAILITIIGLIIATKTTGILQMWIDAIVAIGFVIYAFRKVLNPFSKRGNKAERLLKRIVSGDLNDPDEIQKAWLKL